MSILKKTACALTIIAALGTMSVATAQPQSTNSATVGSAADSTARKYTIFMQVKTRDAWLQLSVQERLTYIGKNVFPILSRNPSVKLRFYDAEFYSARLSDVMLIETTDLIQYERVIDALRDSEFWHKYFDVLDITMATENPLVDFSKARTTAPKQ